MILVEDKRIAIICAWRLEAGITQAVGPLQISQGSQNKARAIASSHIEVHY
jgi:hypothetical protein